MILDLDHRKQWPDELQVLLKKFPRDTWKGKTSSLSQFWLDKHDEFRYQGKLLNDITQQYREQALGEEEFINRLAPPLQMFLSHLQGHHSIEDSHYFPNFKEADPRLAPGFEVLEADHDLLHQGINDIIENFNIFIGSVRSDSSSGDLQRIAETYLMCSDLFFKRIVQHLDDEEDLIIPLMLEQGQ